MNLDERKRKILSAVVDEYIKTGEPVGSKTLMDSFNVSSATIRNEMSDLENLGFLCKPHTSAGRIPSNSGYRYYVKTSLNPYKLTKTDILSLASETEKCIGFMETIKTLSASLADFSRCTVFAVCPSYAGGVCTFEVVLSGKKTMAIMAISSGGTVKSCFARMSEEISKEDAAKLTNILNTVLSGFPVEQIGKTRLMMLEIEIKKNNIKLIEIIQPLSDLIEQVKTHELYISGSSNLLSYPEFANIEIAREYMDMLSRHKKITDELLKYSTENQTRVVIGDENTLISNQSTSIISMKTQTDIPVILGLMGPTRMNYAKIMAGCKYVSKKMKKIFDEEI